MYRLDVSADVFSKIWALREEGEETEDHILRRLLDCPKAPDVAVPGAGDADVPGAVPGTLPPPGTEKDAAGFVDATYGLHFPEGFRISRVYKGRPYAARVHRGRWLLDSDGRTYDSFNRLSQAVIDGNENAWMFWRFPGPGGRLVKIAELRDPALVQKRPRRNRSGKSSGPGSGPADLGADMRAKGAKTGAAPVAPAPVAPAAAPGPGSGPPPASPLPSHPASPGMAWEPPPKPKRE